MKSWATVRWTNAADPVVYCVLFTWCWMSWRLFCVLKAVHEALSHQFTDQQYFTTTLCHCCQSIIWGIGSQGYQCSSMFHVSVSVVCSAFTTSFLCSSCLFWYISISQVIGWEDWVFLVCGSIYAERATCYLHPTIWVDQTKWLKVGSCNFHLTVAPSL